MASATVRRDAYLRAQGVRVLRVAAVTVLADPEAVAAWLVDLARAPPQSADEEIR